MLLSQLPKPQSTHNNCLSSHSTGHRLLSREYLGSQSRVCRALTRIETAGTYPKSPHEALILSYIILISNTHERVGVECLGGFDKHV